MYKKLGKKIREERLKMGYTQEVLGEKINSSGAYIGQIERGERNASINKLLLISTTLKVSLDYLLGINQCIELEQMDKKIADELKLATNKQKWLMMDIIKAIKKYQ